jgi:hypothetical protein
MKKFISIPALAFCWMWAASEARACSCERINPVAGYDRAQYVFTGRVMTADHHEWLIEIDRVWKSHQKLGRTIKLKDAYAFTSCESFFRQGQHYVFFAIVAKGGRHVFYHPQVCNWTSPLKAMRVPAQYGSLWIEDFIAQEYGPGEPPRNTP